MNYIWLLFRFKGRIERARYLVVELTLLALWIVLWPTLFQSSSPWEAFYWVAAIAMIWVNAATTVKRLHDHNRSGWWAVGIFVVHRLSYLYYGLFFGSSFGIDTSIAWEMLLLVMFAVVLSLLQTWIFIELFFLMGTDGPNRFGPDPTRTAPAAAIASRPQPQGVPDFLVRRSGLGPV